MTTATHAVAAGDSSSPLDAFTGSFAPTKTGPLYTAGLVVVAVAMVLLPLIYISLIGLVGWGVVFHLMHDTWLFEGGSGRGGLARLILYLGPAVAGAILIFFMVKPFFAGKPKEAEPITLDPASEPVLFAFVKKICALVGAPAPCRIDVDCQVNASASLRRGLWSRDLVLTIGLPLASGLNMREFAGVLAHEFGHFAQGAGMRLTYIIRKINFWFARVVYERDAWDVRLEQTARDSDWRLAVVLHAARGCVWVTRRILWALMHAGNAISCFMLRQMEFDADSYEAKLAGSDAFESTAAQLRVLSVATQVAYEDVMQSWASKRLPENLPLLIGHKVTTLPDEVHQKLASSAASAKTGWFDTHPCDGDRVTAARRLNQPGVFRLENPARELFADFDALSRSVTRHHYEKEHELTFTDDNLMPAEEILRESAASAEADAMVREFYGAVNVSLVPLFSSPDFSPDSSAQRDEALRAVQTLRMEAERMSAEAIEHRRRIVDLNSARCLAKAGFKVEPAEFGLPENATTPGQQESAARSTLASASTTAVACTARIEPFVAAVRARVVSALAASPSHAQEAADLVKLLTAVGGAMSSVEELAAKLPAFTLLAQNRGSHSAPHEVDEIALPLAQELREITTGIEKRLAGFTYPFSHARGSLTVAEYLRPEEKGETEWHEAYLAADSHIKKMYALHYRLLGRVLGIAAAAERNTGAAA